jgi:hypothetical protein
MKSNNIEKVLIISGVDGGRGWKRDVKNMLLDIAKLKKRGMETRTQHQTSHTRGNATSNNRTVKV